MKGRIINKTANSFDVLVNNEVHNCFARGTVRNDAKLLVGDFVKLVTVSDKYVIESILPRVNSLVRPYIANINQLIIVISTQPKPDLLIIDKLLIGCKINNITPIIVVNKSDLNHQGFFEEIYNQYKDVVVNIIETSASTKKGVQELEDLLKNNLSTFTGQSGVGKSSLINTIFTDLNIKTGEISHRINMGKNTTRHTQIYVLDNNTLIADTPGFNMLDFNDIDPVDLKNYYSEFEKYDQDCAFRNCVHINTKENKCGVIKALNQNKLNNDRYLRYSQLYQKLHDIWRRKYD